MNLISYTKVKFNKMLGFLLFFFQNKMIHTYLKRRLKKDGITLVVYRNKILSTFQQNIMNRYFDKEDVKYREN